MFFRIEPMAKYYAGYNLGSPLVPHGKTLDDHKRHHRNYEIVLDISAKTGNSFQKVIFDAMPKRVISEAFVAASPAFWALLCEKVRLRYHPDMPSRLTSIFAFQDMKNADRFANVFKRESRSHGNRYGEDGLVAYEVICGLDQKKCTFDMNIIDNLHADLNFEQAIQEIRKYWRCERSTTPLLECLLEGEVFRGNRVKEY